MSDITFKLMKVIRDYGSVHVNVSYRKNKNYSRYTMYVCEANQWDFETGYPKSTSKVLKRKYLDDLKDHLDSRLLLLKSEGTKVSSKWLKEEINSYFNR